MNKTTRPIMAVIQFVDGDKVPMMFQSWGALGRWMAENVGRYCGINAAPINGGLEKPQKEADNDT